MSEENQTTNDSDVAAVESWAAKCQGLRAELQKSIIGQEDVIEQVLIAILALILIMIFCSLFTEDEAASLTPLKTGSEHRSTSDQLAYVEKRTPPLPSR